MNKVSVSLRCPVYRRINKYAELLKSSEAHLQFRSLTFPGKQSAFLPRLPTITVLAHGKYPNGSNLLASACSVTLGSDTVAIIIKCLQ